MSKVKSENKGTVKTVKTRKVAADIIAFREEDNKVHIANSLDIYEEMLTDSIETIEEEKAEVERLAAVAVKNCKKEIKKLKKAIQDVDTEITQKRCSIPVMRTNKENTAFFKTFHEEVGELRGKVRSGMLSIEAQEKEISRINEKMKEDVAKLDEEIMNAKTDIKNIQ